MRTHSGEKPYTCNICEKGFTNSSYLTKHMRTHSGEKPYTCNLCEKGFTQQNSLTIHIRIHSGEKPYTCNICEKGFTQHGNFTRHMKLHRGEKPHKCSVCGRRFTRKSHLNSHMKIHIIENDCKWYVLLDSAAGCTQSKVNTSGTKWILHWKLSHIINNIYYLNVKYFLCCKPNGDVWINSNSQLQVCHLTPLLFNLLLQSKIYVTQNKIQWVIQLALFLLCGWFDCSKMNVSVAFYIYYFFIRLGLKGHHIDIEVHLWYMMIHPSDRGWPDQESNPYHWSYLVL